MALPHEFTEKMKLLLGAEYEAFLASYSQPRHFGLRVNTLKISAQDFERLAPFHLTRIPWVANGYYYEEQDAPARHPFYHAGLYYLQEPSAMTPASVLPVKPGDRVLDLCAAPGGKATELGAKLSGRGLLVANDISASRAKALLKNIEVSGITNAFVTNETPAKLAQQFPEFFNRILVDAPCSGEGMFRKDPATARAWDAQKPLRCAKQQKEILGRAADMLAPGGQLLYSTCTFSPEENEQVIAWLLRERGDMELLDIPRYEGFSEGLPWTATDKWSAADRKGVAGERRGAGEWSVAEKLGSAGEGNAAEKLGSAGEWSITEARRGADEGSAADRQGVAADLRKCVRIFPHRMAGEGHFLALLRKKGGCAVDDAPVDADCPKTRDDVRQAQAILLDFLRDVSLPLEAQRLEIRKGQAYYVPQLPGHLKGISFLRNGLYLGEVKKDRFEPSQSLAMALSKERYAQTLDFDYRDERVLRYLKGETIETDGCADAKEKGWRLVCVNGYPLGWGKLTGGLLKNKYHAGWRMNP